jgi:TetR/AcrR family transcriptional repressor of nem operon
VLVPWPGGIGNLGNHRVLTATLGRASDRSLRAPAAGRCICMLRASGGGKMGERSGSCRRRHPGLPSSEAARGGTKTNGDGDRLTTQKSSWTLSTSRLNCQDGTASQTDGQEDKTQRSTATANARTGTAERMLDCAEQLVQTRGFNGFSYADIARELGVTKASLHYHFPTKAALGVRLIERYGDAFAAALADIDASATDAPAKVRAYVDIYSGVLRNDRMCLCGMLAADFATLPEPMKSAVTRFFEANEQWLAAVLSRGRAAGELRFTGAPLEVARLLVGSLEGAMLVARSFGDPGRFQAIADRLLAELSDGERDMATSSR